MMLLTISHGQDSVERGYSVNKDRAKGKAQELGVNSIIYSAALPFICEIKQKLNKLYVAKYYCYSHVIYEARHHTKWDKCRDF